jgi:hypothetical protein
VLMVALCCLTAFFAYGLSEWYAFVLAGVLLGTGQGFMWWRAVLIARPKIEDAVSLKEFQRALFSTSFGKVYRFATWAVVGLAAFVAFVGQEGQRISIFATICGSAAAATALSQIVAVRKARRSA